jgi:uncharacterized repeat protein (TIGR03803 family)
MKRYLVFDAGCVACSALARDIERLVNGRLEVISLNAWATRELLSQVFPDGWQERPYLLTVDQGRVSAASGNELALKLLLLLGPQKAWRVLTLAERYGVELPFGGGDFSVQRRRLLQLAAMFSGGLIATRLDPVEARVTPRKKLISQSSDPVTYYSLPEDQALALDKVTTSSADFAAVKSQLGPDFAPALDFAFVMGRKDSSSDVILVTIPILYKGQYSESTFNAIVDPITQELYETFAFTTEIITTGSKSLSWINGQLIVDATFNEQGTVVSGYKVENGGKVDISGQNYVPQGQAAVDSFQQSLQSGASAQASLASAQLIGINEELSDCSGQFEWIDRQFGTMAVLIPLLCSYSRVPRWVATCTFVAEVLLAIAYNAVITIYCMVTTKAKQSKPPVIYNPIFFLDVFNGENGKYPNGLALGADGRFYGTTPSGGEHNRGTVFRISPPNGSIETVVGFDGKKGGTPDTDIYMPQTALALGRDSNFYGTTGKADGTHNGSVFTVTPGGEVEAIHIFDLDNGSNPQAALTLGVDGNFYGTTYAGGSSSSRSGTVFRITPSGAFTPLVSFTGDNGARPNAALTYGRDGNFYGTTLEGGTNSAGTVFRISPDGQITTLINFGSHHSDPARKIYPGGGPNGLALGRDGNLYGTTRLGGGKPPNDDDPSSNGIVFRMSPDGKFDILYQFSDITGEGYSPYSSLLLGYDGNFYGTTSAGGSGDRGTVFRITPEGELTTLTEFSSNLYPYKGNTRSGLIQDRSGNLYGVIEGAGSTQLGLIYSVPIK